MGLGFQIGMILAVYVLANSTANYLLKCAPNLWSARFMAGLIFQIAGFLFLLILIKLLPLSIAIPITTGLLIMSNSLIGHFSLREHISRVNILGYGLVILGVCLVYLTL